MIRSLLFIFVLVSCSTSKEVTKKEYSSDNQICNLNISFRSLGAGIDRKSYKVFLTYLEEFENEEKIKLSYEQLFWGREGEMDYCFKYENLTQKQIQKLEKEIKEKFIESKTVSISKETAKRKGR